jgi:threonine/homoserine/homoserine lactone efflux protein
LFEPDHLPMFSPTEWSALLLLATATSFTPGPNTTLSTALAANGGLRHALPFVLAVPVGWTLLLTLSSLGLGTLVLAVPALRWALLLTGCAYLMWLAKRLWGAGTLTTLQDAPLRVGFWQGIGLQFVNIKAWMLALSLVAGWVAGQPDALARYALLMPMMLAFAFASNMSYALIGSLLRQWLAKGRRLLVFNRCMASALALTALWLLWSTR